MHNYGRFRAEPKSYMMFRELAMAFNEGRLYLDECPEYTKCSDLIIQNDRIYLYWPPVPALLYMPLVKYYGYNTPDTLVVSIFGALDILLLSLFLANVSRRYDLKLKYWHISMMVLFYGMGTVHFYTSLLGTIWTLAQNIGHSFILACLLLFIKKPSSYRYLLLSGICFALACYTKNNLLFYLFLLLGIAWPQFANFNTRQIMSRMTVFILPFLIASCLNMWYNHARFGNVFENGLNYHNMAKGYRLNFEKHGYFDIRYFPHNFFVCVLRPPKLIDEFPFLFDPKNKYGFSFFWSSPVFFLLLPALYILYKRMNDRRSMTSIHGPPFSAQSMMIGNFVTLIAISTLVLCIMGTGWRQFASRYSLDYQLCIILPIVFLVSHLQNRKWFWVVYVILLMVSLYIHYFGTWYFTGLYKYSGAFWKAAINN